MIHGYPRTLVSFPLAGTVIPPWFAEGMAQLHRAGLDYDTWDTHRDMLLRTAVMEGGLLSLKDMSIYGKNSLGNERVYNQGYGLALYIARRYGEDVIPRLAAAMKAPLRTGFSGAVKKVLQKSEADLYAEWNEWLRQEYTKTTESMVGNAVQGSVIRPRGVGSFHPVFSPDGRSVAYISTGSRDYLSQLSLRIIEPESGRDRRVKSGVTSSVSWSPDGRKLVYAKKTARTGWGSHFYDLYIYDLNTKKEERLTRSLRARQPDWSPNGKKFVCVVEEDGTANLAVIGADGIGFKRITDFHDGEQVYSPRWMGKEGRIVFTVSTTGRPRDIAVIDSSGKDFTYLIRTEHDERDAFPDAEGHAVYYASDKSGIFNIYKLDLVTRSETQLTNVLGGAFMPSVNGKGVLVYALFQTGGYRIALIDSLAFVETQHNYTSPYDVLAEEHPFREWSISEYDDSEVPEYASQPYKTAYSKIALLPRIMLDYPQKVKVGTYFYGSDFLDKVSMLGGAAVNGLWDTDIFLIFEYKRLYPTLFIEAYQQTRHVTIDQIDANFKLRYNLMEADIGADWRIGDDNTLRTAFVYSRYSYAGSGEFPYQNVFGKFTSVYHKGNVIQLRWTHRNVPASVISPVGPDRGRSVTLEIDRAWQSYGDSAAISEKHGTPIDVYSRHGYEEFRLDWREHLPGILRGHSMRLRLKAGLIDKPVPGFYSFFAGGLDGLKGYPFYSIEGRKLMHVGLAYRFPVFRRMNLRFLFLHFDKLFASLYGDAGNAWNEGKIDVSRWKRVLGAQLRLRMVSFYTYPMSVFFDAAYGLDRYTHRDIEYGEEWRFYFGILFDFLD